ncbi:MAG: MoaD family protein [Candidatus Lokiarchaeota archaeon]|nr:MoaD family protein [Candidatus Lokiarchaeota archaeon]
MDELITIEVRIFATLRDILGLKKFPMHIKAGSTIRDLLHTIQQVFDKGKEFIKEVSDPEDLNRIRDHVKFMINGIILFQDKILDTTIHKDGDVIAIFPPIGGG